MTATSGPGFSLMQEAIGFAVMVETPCVIVDVQRVGPSSGGIFSQQGDVMQARWGTHGNVHEIITISPSSVQELFDLTVHAFKLSEQFRTPVIILTEEAAVHTSENVEAPKEIAEAHRRKPMMPAGEFIPFDGPPEGVPPMPSLCDGYTLHYCGQLHDVHGFPRLSLEKYSDTKAVHKRLSSKIKLNLADITRFETRLMDGAEVAVLAYGFEARAAARAVLEARGEGLRVGLLRPVTIWPFDGKKLKRLCAKVQKVLVCEANAGQLVVEVRASLRGECKVELLPKLGGVHSPREILDEIGRLC